MEKSKQTSNNMNAFIDLMERYRAITLEEIKAAEVEGLITMLHYPQDPYGYIIAQRLTNFGSSECTLCKATIFGCTRCYWTVKAKEGCAKHFTYMDIWNAKNKKELKAAMNARADYMESVL